MEHIAMRPTDCNTAARAEIERQVSEYLSRGGEINRVESGATAIPFKPKRTSSERVQHLKRFMVNGVRG